MPGMPKTSAGLLMYRRSGGAIEVLLVHPGGPFWAKKDLGAWSVPKGECEPAEDELEAARREVNEETGLAPGGPFTPLQAVKQPSGKLVVAWIVKFDCDPATIRSNTFSLEWPPKSGRKADFPEVDRAEWFSLQEARARIQPGQLSLLDQLERLLA